MFLEQKAEGFSVWQQPMIQLRLPMLFNLRSDPFERAQHESGDYVRWFIEHAFVILPAQGIVAQHLASFANFRHVKGLAPFRLNRPWRNCGIHRRTTNGRLASAVGTCR